jgi:MFS family permease
MWIMLPLVMLYGAANGMNIPSILTLLSGLAPPEYRAAFMSVNGMVLRLGQTLGPIVAAAMLQFGGLSGAFYGSAMLALVTLAGIHVLVKQPVT